MKTFICVTYSPHSQEPLERQHKNGLGSWAASSCQKLKDSEQLECPIDQTDSQPNNK